MRCIVNNEYFSVSYTHRQIGKSIKEDVLYNFYIVYAMSTQLPDKKLLSEKLQRAIAIAKEHYTNVAIIGV